MIMYKPSRFLVTALLLCKVTSLNWTAPSNNRIGITEGCYPAFFRDVGKWEPAVMPTGKGWRDRVLTLCQAKCESLESCWGLNFNNHSKRSSGFGCYFFKYCNIVLSTKADSGIVYTHLQSRSNSAISTTAPSSQSTTVPTTSPSGSPVAATSQRKPTLPITPAPLSMLPTMAPSTVPSSSPTSSHSVSPTTLPTSSHSVSPTTTPTSSPSVSPTTRVLSTDYFRNTTSFPSQVPTVRPAIVSNDTMLTDAIPPSALFFKPPSTARTKESPLTLSPSSGPGVARVKIKSGLDSNIERKSLAVMIAVVSLFLAGFFLLKKLDINALQQGATRRPYHTTLIFTVGCLGDLVSDFFLAAKLHDEGSDLFIFSAVFISLPIMFNMIFLLWEIRRLARKSPKFALWLSENSTSTSLISLASLCNTGIFSMVCCDAFGSEKLSAPLSETDRQRLFSFGLSNLFFEDLPQIAITSVLLARGDDSLVIRISLVASILALMILCFKKTIAAILHRTLLDEQDHSHLVTKTGSQKNSMEVLVLQDQPSLHSNRHTSPAAAAAATKTPRRSEFSARRATSTHFFRRRCTSI